MTWKPNRVQTGDTTSGKLISENRALNQRRDDDVIKNFSVTLLDIDQVIYDHLTKKVNPQVKENGGEIVKVPIIYGSPERWKSIRQDGFLRDKKGKIQIPLLVYKRNSVAKDESLITLNRHLQYPVIKNYSEKNQYDKFSKILGMCPVKEVYNVTLPDHIIVTYDCVLWTEYVEQNNSVIEAINFTEDDYWGDKRRYKFRAKIENYSHTTEVPADSDRMIRSEFSINMYAYLLPEQSENKQTTQKYLTKRKIIFNMEIDTGIAPPPKPIERHKCGTSSNITENQGALNGLANVYPATVQFSVIMAFLSLNKAMTGTYINDDGIGHSVVYFYNAELMDTPQPLINTISDIDKFSILVNGQLIEKEALSFTQVGTTLQVKINNSINGYSLDATDEIIALGKFK